MTSDKTSGEQPPKPQASERKPHAGEGGGNISQSPDGSGGRKRRPDGPTVAKAYELMFLPTLTTPYPPPIHPPKEWTRGVRPSGKAALPGLDKIIENILAKKKPNLQECPYYTARFWIVMAAEMGGKSVRKEAALIKDRKSFASTINDAANILKNIIEHENPKINDELNFIPYTARGFTRPDYDAENILRKRFYTLLDDIRPAAPALAELAQMMADAESKHIGDMSANTSPWMFGFIEMLGYYWTSIWGDVPSKTGDSSFARFAQAAYAALGGDEDEITTQTMRTIVARVRGGGGYQGRPENDQFDRYERMMREQQAYRDSIGEERWAEEVAAEQKAWRDRMASRPTAHQADLRDIFDAAKGGHEQAMARLDYIYANSGAADRAYLESLGYQPPRN